MNKLTQIQTARKQATLYCAKKFEWNIENHMSLEETKERPTSLLNKMAKEGCYPYTATIKNKLRPYICFYDSLQLVEDKMESLRH